MRKRERLSIGKGETNAMVRYMLGIIGVVLVLIGIVLGHEPERDGISRAAAYKAAALSIASVEECVGESYAKKSYFAADEKGQWYVKYMDYLYRRDMISLELTPPETQTAEGILTYAEAAYLLDGLLKESGTEDGIDMPIHVTRWNRDKQYPAEQWWRAYREVCMTSEEAKVTEQLCVVYATPDIMPGGEEWTAYTDCGKYRFEGLAVGQYLDQQVRLYVRDQEILHVAEVVSDEVVYRNIWMTAAGEQTLSGYLGEFCRNWESTKKIKEPEKLEHQIVDLYLSKGNVKKLVAKKERISGKVLAVREDSIEVEGYGSVALDTDFRIYKIYEELKCQTLSDILVGYDAQEFVVADGKICAALTVRPIEAETIRVLITDRTFTSMTHDAIELEFLGSGRYLVDEKETAFSAGDEMTLTADHLFFKKGRVIFEPDDPQKGIRIKNLERSYGTPIYPGRLEVAKEADSLVVINELYLEDYLKRVVPSEMPVSYEKEALKAQAVCARTYAYRQIQANQYREYGAHVDDSTRFQVYNNVETSSISDMAVQETYGKLLMYEGKAAEAFYFSTSCGHTTDGTIWGSSLDEVPYLKGIAVNRNQSAPDLTNSENFTSFIKSVPDSYESGFAMYRWNTKLTSGQLEEKFPELGKVTDVEIKKRAVGGIGEQLAIIGTNGTKEITGEGKIRAALGHPELVICKKDGTTVTDWSSLPSAFITVEKAGQNSNGETVFAVYGGGFGHGVGMSQNGAQGMAKEGTTYQEILEFFYQGAEVRTAE